MPSFRLGLVVLAFVVFAISTHAQPQLTRDYVRGPGGKLAVTIEPDNNPPDDPPGLSAYATGCLAVDASWSASSDIGSGVSAYYVYRDSSFVGSTSGTSYSSIDTGSTSGGWLTISVAALDAAGNLGNESSTQVEFPPCEIPEELFSDPFLAAKPRPRVGYLGLDWPFPEPAVTDSQVQYFCRIRSVLAVTRKPEVVVASAGGGQ